MNHFSHTFSLFPVYQQGIFGLIVSGIIIILPILLLVFVIDTLLGLPETENYQEISALQILNQRYANGELSKEEYEDKRQDILSLSP